ncbi:protein-L-isoaspartate(D-aspartate) O-methyltransferase [Murinocardiopsis flavida]|uniref:Protein-L-isoaspartate O-methyltransferase n=1 Tax=Murinocardiopsis flavida TaxID=645275 RepID=A0A2P8DG54_9ACTN|nr:methyltransferase, FxLD system [Murinocardiopsis flavida]PSK96186.1 protein-L-isoaspartate(D-aspartate) O-methyltransferase [Murinocardiopsis flavida]
MPENPAAPAQHASAAQLRTALADQLRDGGHTRTPAVEEALHTVARHLFLPDTGLEDAYANDTVAIKHAADGTALSCASQPSIVALQLEQLEARPAQRILELGAGTGYNAALLGRLVGDRGQVITVDVDDELLAGARARLAETGVANVETILGDGALGHPPGAPYDRIIATVGAHHLPVAWLEQLAPGGRLVAPVRIAGDAHRSIAFEAEGEHWRGVDSRMCTFMPLRNSIGDDPRRRLDITGHNTVHLHINQDQRIENAQVRGVLEEPAATVWTGVEFGTGQSFEPMWMWLALSLDNPVSRMPVQRRAVEEGLVAPGLRWGDMAGVPTSGRGLAYMTTRPAPGAPGREVGVIGHAQAGHALAEEMAALIQQWQRRRDQEITFALYPATAQVPAAAPGRFVLERGAHRLIVSWATP